MAASHGLLGYPAFRRVTQTAGSAEEILASAEATTATSTRISQGSPPPPLPPGFHQPSARGSNNFESLSPM